MRERHPITRPALCCMRAHKARVPEATRISGATSCLTCQCSPSSRQLTHLRSGTLGSEDLSCSRCVLAELDRLVKQFSVWTRQSTPGPMSNFRAAGRLMPVAQASDSVTLCLLGKTFEDRTEPEPRQFLRFFDFEAETIETRSLRHAAALPAQPARRESARRALGRGTRRLAAAFQVRLDLTGRP